MAPLITRETRHQRQIVAIVIACWPNVDLCHLPGFDGESVAYGNRIHVSPLKYVYCIGRRMDNRLTGKIE
jgi:hypothetical protein